MPVRPRLTPEVALVRRAVREVLPLIPPRECPEALVALSGGPDSLALAAAAAFEGPRAGRRIGGGAGGDAGAVFRPCGRRLRRGEQCQQRGAAPQAPQGSGQAGEGPEHGVAGVRLASSGDRA